MPRTNAHTRYVAAPPIQQTKILIISEDSFKITEQIITTTAITAVETRIFKTQTRKPFVIIPRFRAEAIINAAKPIMFADIAAEKAKAL